MSPEECSAPMAGMLTGYRVLDLCDAKGALCTKLMADLGADVIAIEPPGGSPLRTRTPFYHDRADPEMSLYFWYFHTNKRSITLNLETPDGQALLNDLVNTADVWVETTSPGYLDALGLDYSHLQALNPRLIMTSITGFGREGPPRSMPPCALRNAVAVASTPASSGRTQCVRLQRLTRYACRRDRPVHEG